MKKLLLFYSFLLALASPALAATGCMQAATAISPVYTQSSGNVAAATATATLPTPPAGTRWNIIAFEITGLGATSAAGVAPTITGLDGGAGTSVTATFSFAAVAGATLIDTPLTPIFAACPLAGAPGTAVVLSMPSLGAGNTNAAVTIHGFLSQ